METITTVRIDPANAAQAEAWDGDEGAFWAANPDRFDEALRDYHDAFAAAAAVRTTDRVLDVGCGNGETSLDAARLATEGRVVGVDLSAAMLSVARQRAADAGLGNVEFVQADAQVHPFQREGFDVVLSRTGAMFFGDLSAGLTNLARATVPGGRLVLLVWQPLAVNEWLSEIATALAAGRELPAPTADAPGPFSLSDPERNTALLTAAGWTDIEHTPLTGLMRFGATVDRAFEFVTGLMGWMLDGLDDKARDRALKSLHDSLSRHVTPTGVGYRSGAWLVTATRAAQT